MLRSAYPPSVRVCTSATSTETSAGRRCSKAMFICWMVARSTSLGSGVRMNVLGRQLDPAGAEVGQRHGRDPVLDRERAVLLGGLVEEDVVGVGPAHRTRPGQGIERPPVPGAQHRLLAEAIDRAQPGGDVELLDVDADVLGDVADAAEQDLVGVQVEALDAAVRARHQRDTSRSAGPGSGSACCSRASGRSRTGACCHSRPVISISCTSFCRIGGQAEDEGRQLVPDLRDVPGGRR